jgi:hypothetical protein
MDGRERSTQERRSVYQGSRAIAIGSGGCSERNRGGCRSRYFVEEVLGSIPQRWGGEVGIWGCVFDLDPRDLAAVKGAMEKRGLSTGDPEFVGMFNSSLQQIASAATAGGGIGFAQGRVDLAKETTATISQSPLHALIALDETADRKLAKLQNMRKNMSPSEPKEGVDDAIKHYQDVKVHHRDIECVCGGQGHSQRTTGCAVRWQSGRSEDVQEDRRWEEGI